MATPPHFRFTEPANPTQEAMLTARLEFACVVLDKLFNADAEGDDREWGFTLLVFPFGTTHHGRAAFMSNRLKPEEAVAVWRAMIDTIEGRVAPGPGNDPPEGEHRLRNQGKPTGPGSTLAARWERVRAHVLPQDMTKAGVRVFRNAFYIGAAEMIRLMEENLNNLGDEPSIAEQAWLVAIRDELMEYLAP
jgi:hypothetical protein